MDKSCTYTIFCASTHILTKMNNKKLERQLANPKGKKGIKLGDKMYHVNLDMIKVAIKQLNIQDGNAILEIGHGNCKHLPLVLTKALDITYCGIEISKTMNKEALKYSCDISADGICDFLCYDGCELPYKINSFDRVFSVNSIYFWKEPLNTMHQIYRVLKENGLLVITFAEKNFMSTLPFVNEKFTLYNQNNFENLIARTSFEIEDISFKKDMVESKSGVIMLRKYFSFLLKK